MAAQQLTEPTPYDDVNAALAVLTAQMQQALGEHCVGIYLAGSLALGDFDPKSSDIDLVVVTEGMLTDAEVGRLRALHEDFGSSASPWAAKVEVVYVDRAGLRRPLPTSTRYPQVENERGFFLEQLEDGWLSQCFIVREHGVTLAGPDPKTLIDPVDTDAMRRMMAAIPQMWQREAANDPTWIDWLRVRHNQSFVTLTLCRLLYTLERGEVASKPAAARWAQGALPERWARMIERAPGDKLDQSPVPEGEIEETVALVAYTVGRFQAWQDLE